MALSPPPSKEKRRKIALSPHYRISFTLIRNQYKLTHPHSKKLIKYKVPKEQKNRLSFHNFLLIDQPKDQTTGESFSLDTIPHIKERVLKMMISLYRYDKDFDAAERQWKEHDSYMRMSFRDYFQTLVLLEEKKLRRLNAELEYLAYAATRRDLIENEKYYGLPARKLYKHLKEAAGKHVMVCKRFKNRIYLKDIRQDFDKNFNIIDEDHNDKTWRRPDITKEDKIFFGKHTASDRYH